MQGLNEALEIRLIEVATLEIHGSRYYQVTYEELATGRTGEMRVNPEAFYENPRAGDRVAVRMLMGMPMGATRLD